MFESHLCGHLWSAKKMLQSIHPSQGPTFWYSTLQEIFTFFGLAGVSTEGSERFGATSQVSRNAHLSWSFRIEKRFSDCQSDKVGLALLLCLRLFFFATC